jgi:hypothetical protein
LHINVHNLIIRQYDIPMMQQAWLVGQEVTVLK